MNPFLYVSAYFIIDIHVDIYYKKQTLRCHSKLCIQQQHEQYIALFYLRTFSQEFSFVQNVMVVPKSLLLCSSSSSSSTKVILGKHLQRI